MTARAFSEAESRARHRRAFERAVAEGVTLAAARRAEVEDRWAARDAQRIRQEIARCGTEAPAQPWDARWMMRD